MLSSACLLYTSLFRPDFEVPSDTVEELYISDGKMLIISNHAGDKDETICYSYDIAAVSYTHLDVYKRQVYRQIYFTE